MDREVEWGRKNDEEAQLLSSKAAAQVSHGQLKAAELTLRDAEAAANRVGNQEFAAYLKSQAAVRYALFGDCSSARTEANTSLAQMPAGASVQISLFAFALCGDVPKTEQLIDQETHQFSVHTFTQVITVPVARAFLDLHRNEPAGALAQLEAARAYDYGAGRDNPAFWPIYARGLAYLQMKDGAKATPEFQKILDHRLVNAISSLVPLAQLSLARAYALAGDAGKAKSAYQDFFALWKDAEPEVPVLLQAKEGYTKLK